MNALQASLSSLTGLTERVQDFYYRTKYPQKPIPNLHALIIGIDAYASDEISTLSGAVADTDLMDRFLRNELSVPSNQIAILRNQEATRSAIISHFDALREKPEIQPLDPILIYYAGHGSEVDTPNARKVTGSKTQCIVPQDVGLQDETGSIICPIPDYTLSALLYDLAEEKGNNITVIFDCCHSASSTRGVLNTSRTPSPTASNVSLPSTNPPSPVESVSSDVGRSRYTDPSTLPRLKSHLDKDILTREVGELPQSSITRKFLGSRSSQRGMRSHVLLAACGHSEKAFERETGGGGYFTSQLLDHLRRNKIDKLTYKTCMKTFPTLKTPRYPLTLFILGPQNPVCEGEHVNRFFFNASVPGAHRSFIPIVYDGRGYILEAGMAQGIMPYSRFKVYTDDTPGAHNPEIGTCLVHVSQKGPWVSVCRLNGKTKELLDRQRLGLDVSAPPTPYNTDFLAPPVAGGIQSLAGPCPDANQSSEVVFRAFARMIEPKMDTSLDTYLTDAFQRAFQGDLTTLIDPLQSQNQVYSEAEAGVVLGLDTQLGNVTFTLTNPILEPGQNSDPRLLPHTVHPDSASVKHVLYAMSQWNWQVSRRHDQPPLSNDLQLEFYQLEKCDCGDGEENMEVVSDNLNNQGVATIVASSEVSYGIRIVNKTDSQLHAYPFYFSTANQSIRPLFLKVHGGDQVDAHIEPNSDMTMGYGDDDHLPISFQPTHDAGISPDVLDVGILRVFVATSHADFESVSQPSPFAALGWIKPGDDEFADGVSFGDKPTAAAAGKDVESELRISVGLDPRPDNVDPAMPVASPFAGFAPGSAGFAPPSPGFAPSSPGFAPASPGFAPPSPGFAPASPGFGPASAGFGPASAEFSPFSAGFAPPSPGFGPPSPGFAPSSPGFGSTSAGFGPTPAELSPYSAGFASSSGFASPSGFGASEFDDNMFDYPDEMPCDGLLASDADVKRMHQIPLWDVIDMKIVIRRGV